MSYVPRPSGVLGWPRAVIYYVYIALATLVLGVLGLPFALFGGKRGANMIATAWLGQMMGAARLILGIKVELRGTPPSGDCIVAAKHQSFLDILAIAQALPERAFIMKREIMRVPIMGWFAYKVGSIPIDRAKGGDAIKQIIGNVQKARAGEGLGQLIIYPEGTRTPPGMKRKYKWGVANIYRSTDLPVAPVAVNAGLFWNKRGIPMRPGTTIIEFLPIIPPGLSEAELMAQLETGIETASDALLAEAGFVAPQTLAR